MMDKEQVHMLTMSRCLGDHSFKEKYPGGVVATPDVAAITFDEADRYIVIASDGLWDVLTEDQVVTLVSQTDTALEACRQLLIAAKKAWQSREADIPNSDCDDITVTCIMLPCFTRNQDDPLFEIAEDKPQELPASPTGSTPMGRRSIIVVDPSSMEGLSDDDDMHLGGAQSESTSETTHTLFQILPQDGTNTTRVFEQSGPMPSLVKPRPRALSLAPRSRRLGSYGSNALLPLGPVRSGARAKSCYASPTAAGSANKGFGQLDTIHSPFEASPFQHPPLPPPMMIMETHGAASFRVTRR